MLRKTMLPILFGLAVLAGPALAEEVLYFTNGTAMPIVSHTVAEDMIEVVLGGGAFMAFPTGQIERIEDAKGEVALLAGPGNRMVSGSRQTKYLTQGTVPARHRSGKWGGSQSRRTSSGSEVDNDSHGVATIRPYAGSSNDAKSRIRVAGRREVFNAPVSTNAADGPVGTKRVGNKYVIPRNTTGSTARKVQPVGLTARSGSGSSRKSGESGDSGEKK